jgi:cytochrome bd ubiquinol oxidase subunit II
VAEFTLDFPTFWFFALTALWMGYFVLEGFDFGVGMLLGVVGRDDTDRRVMINTIGPHWDGNEVWLVVAGAGTFAAFPAWYATLFSAYFLPLLVLVIALVVRAVAFEYRGKHSSARWRANWDRAIMVCSLLPALLWGVALAGLLNGVPLRSEQFVGDLLDLVQPYALVGGLTTLSLCLLNGSVFLGMKTEGDLRERARSASARIAPVTVLLVTIFTAWTAWGVQGQIIPNLLMLIALTGAVGAMVLTTGRQNEGWTFLVLALTIACFIASLFVQLYPNVMISTLGETQNLTVEGAASSTYTLTIMTIVLVLFFPVVLGYQAVTYYVFRARVGRGQFEGVGQAIGKVADKLGVTEPHPPQSQVDSPRE